MKTLIISFALIVAAQLFVPVKMIHDKQAPLIYGEHFTFKTQPIDPYDPFRGKYVTLHYADNYLEVKNDTKWYNSQIVYVQFYKGKDGFAKVKNISKDAPKNTKFYLKTTVTDVRRGNKSSIVYIYYPFTRYYMEESKALAAERMTSNASMIVYFYKGRASIKKLEVNHVRIEKAAEEHNRHH